jgi:Transposase and inactivated derivatives
MWNFNKILNISGWQIIKVVKENNKIVFYLKQRRKTANCPKCNKTTKIIHSYSKNRTIKNGTILGKVCLLKFTPRRFHCLNCFSVFTEKISLVNHHQRVTQNHKFEVIFNLSNQSFSSGSKKYHVSYHTQRKWLEELIDSQVFNFNKEEKENKPFVLGIDEVSFSGCSMITTVGNITKHALKGVLKSRRKDELKKILKSISPKVKSLISEVVIDMCDFYKKAVEETLPSAKIVVDHFHIIQDANRRIDQERLLLQDINKKKIPRYILTKNKEDLKSQETEFLSSIMKTYPELHMYYLTKERLRDMYKEKTKEEAEKQLRLIISTLTSTDDGELISWGRTLSRWSEYILNYWNNRSTNGFMEGMHNKMKLIKRISFGFKNKKVFIYKVMLSVLITTLLLPQLMT